jgi:hypothetical protein
MGFSTTLRWRRGWRGSETCSSGSTSTVTTRRPSPSGRPRPTTVLTGRIPYASGSAGRSEPRSKRLTPGGLARAAATEPVVRIGSRPRFGFGGSSTLRHAEDLINEGPQQQRWRGADRRHGDLLDPLRNHGSILLRDQIVAMNLDRHGVTMSGTIAYLETERQRCPHRARIEDLITERPTLAIPRLCHNA